MKPWPVLALLTGGCTAVTALPPRPIAPDLRVGKMAERTDFELAVAPERSEPGVEPEQLHPPDVAVDEPFEEPDEARRNQRARTAVFWTGVAVTTLGTAGMISTATAGQVTEKRLTEAYDDGNLSLAREERLTDAGETLNKAAIGSAGVALIGLAMAVISFGLDYTACGKLARRRSNRDCQRRR